MEAAASLFFCLVILTLFVLGLGYAYKKRAFISKWLNTPYCADDDRELRLRRSIEDSAKELADIERQKAEPSD